MNSIPKFACVIVLRLINSIPNVASSGMITMGNNPKTIKKQRNIEKGCKDVKNLQTFPTVSKLNGVCVR